MPIATQKIVPMLWYEANAEEAARFYVSIFPNSRIIDITRYPEGAPTPAGTVMTVIFELAGQQFTALNGGPHAKFNEAISLVVTCEDQAELDRYWDALTSGGGAAVQCGWLMDRFGLRWQIVPAILPELAKGPNGDKVLHAVWQMVKLDIAQLKTAAAGR